MDDDALHDLDAMVFSGDAPGVLAFHVEIKTPSGRTYKYELSTIRISPAMTRNMAMSQARWIFGEKYRYSDWDRRHPEVDVAKEMIESLTDFILHSSRKVERYQARKPQRFLSWGVFLSGQLMEEFIYGQRDEAIRRVAELNSTARL